MTAATLVLLVVRLTGIIAVAAVAAMARRRASAAEHHAIWLMALAGALVLPFAHVALPEWRIGPTVAAPSPISTTTRVAEGRGIGSANQLAPADARATISKPTGTDQPLSTLRSIDVTDAAIALWGVGTLLCLIRLARAHARARRIVKAARPVGVCEHLGISVPVLQSATSTGPFTYGVLHASIIMPADAAGWSGQRRDAVITHEAAHAMRRDGVALLVAEIACAVYWWHPAVLFAARRAAIACERACDDAVVRDGMRASDYGAQLLAQAQAQSSCAWGIRPLATTLFGPSHGIAARIAALLDPRLDRRPLARRRVCALAVLGLSSAGLVAAAAPKVSSAPPPSVTVLPQVEQAEPPVSTATRAPASKPEARPRPLSALAPACSQADARYARTLNVDSSLSFTGAGATRYADGTLLIVWTGVDCTAWVRVRGPVAVDPTWSSVSVGSDAEFAARDDGPGGRRDYVVRADGSASLTINGAPAVLDAEHRAWTAMMVLEYVRRTGLDAGGRARAILARGGVPAILDEARKISGKHVRARYLEAAFSAVVPDQRPAFLHDAASLLDSSFVRGEFLLGIPREWHADQRVLAAIYAEAGVIEPDEYLERLLRVAPPPRPLPTEFKPLIEHIVASLQSVDRRTALRGYYLDVRP